MKLIAPAYYPQFACIAGDCRHSCCIGWEIDIDEKTAAVYRTCSGEIGDRMHENIDFDAEPPHFILQGEQERCPFLNEHGLCDLILARGEEILCQICRDHPRWRNFYSDRTEIGLGLCCEAAAAIVLGWKDPMEFLCLSDDGEATEMTAEEQTSFALRDMLLGILQNREKSFDERIAEMLAHVGGVRFTDLSAWHDYLSQLEILDGAWADWLARIGDERAIFPGYAGEQLMVYLLIRHLPKMLEGEDAAVLISFAVLGYDLISALYAHTDQSFAALCELVRLFSSEIEYSEENLYAVFDEIACN